MPHNQSDPEADRVRTRERICTPAIRPAAVLGWAGGAAVVVAGAALATVTFAGGDGGEGDAPTSPTDRATPSCVWTSQVSVPVFPSEDIGGPPTPESALAIEACNGEWTGDLAWMTPGEDDDAASAPRADELERRAGLDGQRRTHSRDDGTRGRFPGA
jgi:hypothetical protein